MTGRDQQRPEQGQLQRSRHRPHQSQSRQNSPAGPSTTLPWTNIDPQDYGRDELGAWPSNWNAQFLDPETQSAAFPAVTNVISASHRNDTSGDMNTNNSEAQAESNSLMSTFSSGDDYVVPSLDGDFEEALVSQSLVTPPTEHGVHEVTHSPRLSSAEEALSSSEIDSECCQECCKMILDLEAYIGSNITAFKIVIKLIQHTLDSLVYLVELQQSSRNLRCQMLFLTIMCQVLPLLEACLSGIMVEKVRQRTHTLPGVPPGLRFGDTSIDAEERFALRIQIVLREAQHATEVLGKVKTLGGIGPDVGPNNTSTQQGTHRVDCFADLEVRFREFTSRAASER